jgi:hypothetical protein
VTAVHLLDPTADVRPRLGAERAGHRHITVGITLARDAWSAIRVIVFPTRRIAILRPRPAGSGIMV